MVLSLKKFQNKNEATANVADGHLVLSLLNAQEPKIWRMSLEKIGTAAFELKSDKDEQNTKLILKPKKGTAEIIANFDSKEEALEALQLASNALNHKNSFREKITQKTQAHNINEEMPAPISISKKWFVLLLGFIGVVLLYLYVTSLMPETIYEFEQMTTQSNQSGSSQSTGVPLSADEFLSGM
jgi:hypothetical protein